MPKKYQPGMKIGPNNILFKEELSPAISKTGKTKTRIGLFECPICKTLFTARLNHVTSGATKSCGCLHKEKAKENIIDLTNQKFGRLTALEFTEQRSGTSVI